MLQVNPLPRSLKLELSELACGRKAKAVTWQKIND
jgi:hypothetical protein